MSMIVYHITPSLSLFHSLIIRSNASEREGVTGDSFLVQVREGAERGENKWWKSAQ